MCNSHILLTASQEIKKRKIKSLYHPINNPVLSIEKVIDHMYIYIFIHVMDCFCTNILYNFGSLSGTKLSEKYETIISNCLQCHVSLPSKAHVHSGHSERLEADSRKEKNHAKE